MTSLPTFQDLFDPRGRASRSGLLAVALLLIAADVAALVFILSTGAAFTGPGALAFKIVSVWVATAGVSKRLHDLDHSAWWIAKALVVLIFWSIAVAASLLIWFNAVDAQNPAHVAFWLNVTASAAPVLAALIWLHVARGNLGPNRYGAEPDARGFSLPDTSAALTSLDAQPAG